MLSINSLRLFSLSFFYCFSIFTSCLFSNVLDVVTNVRFYLYIPYPHMHNRFRLIFSLSLFLFFSFLLCHEIIARDLKNSTFVWLDGLEFAIYFTGFKLIENHWPYLNGGYNPSKTHIKYNEKHVHRIPSNRLSVCNQSSVIVLVVSIR